MTPLALAKAGKKSGKECVSGTDGIVNIGYLNWFLSDDLRT